MDVAVGHRPLRRRDGHLGRALVGLADAQQDDVVAGAPAGIGPVEHLHHPERLHRPGPGREAPLIGEAGHVRTLPVPIVAPHPRAGQNLGVSFRPVACRLPVLPAWSAPRRTRRRRHP